MTEQARDAEAIFFAALDKTTPQGRVAYVEATCVGDPELLRRVRELLSCHEGSQGLLDAPPPGLGYTVDLSEVSEQPGTVIGPYKLLQQIGEGGMGTVYMAEQTQPVRRTVALKLIKAGMDSRQVLARFGAERQALALMDHPNIARVFDAGTTDAGRPYFVMELVKGIPITRFCDERRLTTRERLELAIPVCQAVQHAHQKGIIHRDLKPSNILIALYDGKPVPKVIDFGVAKATGARLTDQTLYTEFGAVVGTLEYMSPEQAELNQLDIDTRSDVYSLGVLLYELLTGSTPLDRKRLKQGAILEMLRVIREEESPRPSMRLSTTEELPSIAACRNIEPRKLSGLVRGELDWIVMKALEKDRTRRYETANGLAADLRRYLDDEPVQACPPSARYRFGKFARRNKAALTAAGLIAVAMLASVGLLALSNLLITRERDQKEAALVNARISESNAVEQERIARQEFYSAQKSLSQQAFETGRAAFDKGQVGQGLLWTLESWRSAIAARDLARQHLARANVSAWLPYHHRLKAVFSHPSPVEDAAFSPDGKTVVTGGDDGIAQLWDIASGKAIGPPLRHPREVSSVAFSPDGKTILTGCTDGSVRLWEAATGRSAGQPISHDGEGAVTVAFSPDGKSFVTGYSDDRTGQIRDAATLRPVGPVLRGLGIPVAFSRDGKALVTRGGPAQVWDVANRRPLGPTLKVAEVIRSVALSPDGKTILIGQAGGEVRLWDAVTGLPFGASMRHSDRVRDLAFSPDGEVLLSGSNDNTARLWDAVTGRPIGLPLQHQGPVVAVAFSPDGKTFLTTSSDGMVRLWESSLHQPVRLVLQGHGAITKAAFSPDGKSVVTGDDGGAQLWDATDGRPLGAPIRHALAWGPDPIAFSRDGKMLLTGGSDKAARMWAVPSGLPIGTPLMHQDQVSAVAFGPDGRTLITGCLDRTVRLWDAAAGSQLGASLPQVTGVETMAVSPDGKAVLVGYNSGAAQLWDVATRTPLGKSFPHPGCVSDARFSPDGKSFVLAGEDGTARLWDVATRKLRLPPFAHGGWIWAVAFSPDGTIVVTGGDDKTARLWDAATGRPVGPPLRHRDKVHAVGISPGNRSILTGCNDARARLFSNAPEVPDDLDRVANWLEVLTAQTIDLREGSMLTLDNAAWLASRERLEQAGGPPVPLEDSATGAGRSTGLARAVSQVRAEYAKDHLDQAWSLRTSQPAREAIRVLMRAISVSPLPEDRLLLARSYNLLAITLGQEGKSSESIAAYRQGESIAERLIAELPYEPRYLRAMTWSRYNLALVLATCPDANVRDPGRAVELARKAVEGDPQSGMAWQYLGWIQYRAGSWKDSIEALEKSCKLQAGGTGDFAQWIVMALAHWKLEMEKDLPEQERGRHKTEARRLYDQAVKGIRSWKEDPFDQALRAFFGEAAELLGVKVKPK